MTKRHEGLDEMLDESYPTCSIGSLTFYPSEILFACDPIAYQTLVLEYEASI